MASIRDLYRKPIMTAKRFKMKEVKAVIIDTYPEMMKNSKPGDMEKLVLELEGQEFRIALNKTNAIALAAKFGEDYEEWKGKTIKITKIPTKFGNDDTEGLKVEAVK